MATDLKELTEAAQEQTIKAVQAFQATVLDTTTGVVKAFEKLMPESLRTLSIPGFEALPSPADAIASAFDLSEKLLASERSFAEQLFATAPVAPAPVRKGAK